MILVMNFKEDLKVFRKYCIARVYFEVFEGSILTTGYHHLQNVMKERNKNR